VQFVARRAGQDLVVAIRELRNNGASAQVGFWSNNKPGTRHVVELGTPQALRVERIGVYSNANPKELMQGWDLAGGVFVWQSAVARHVWLPGI